MSSPDSPSDDGSTPADPDVEPPASEQPELEHAEPDVDPEVPADPVLPDPGTPDPAAHDDQVDAPDVDVRRRRRVRRRRERDAATLRPRPSEAATETVRGERDRDRRCRRGSGAGGAPIDGQATPAQAFVGSAGARRGQLDRHRGVLRGRRRVAHQPALRQQHRSRRHQRLAHRSPRPPAPTRTDRNHSPPPSA